MDQNPNQLPQKSWTREDGRDRAGAAEGSLGPGTKQYSDRGQSQDQSSDIRERKRSRDPRREREAELSRNVLPQRRSTLRKIFGKTRDWVGRLDALEERTFGTQRQPESSGDGGPRYNDAKCMDAETAFVEDALRSPGQRLQAMQHDLLGNSTNEGQSHDDVDTAGYAGLRAVQNSSSQPQTSSELRNLGHRLHTHVQSHSYRNHTHRDPASIREPHMSGPRRLNNRERRDSYQQHRRPSPSSRDSDSGQSSGSLPSKTSTEMNAVDLSAMSRRVSNAGRGRGRPAGSRSATADPVRATAQRRASMSRASSTTRSQWHDGGSQDYDTHSLQESDLAALPQRNGHAERSTADWVDDQRSRTPVSTFPLTAQGRQSGSYGDQRVVAGPSGYNQNLRGRVGRRISAGVIGHEPTANLDELLARQMQAELDDAVRNETVAAQNDEHMAREMQHEWNEDAAAPNTSCKEDLARDEEVARRVQAELDNGNSIDGKLHRDRLAHDEHVARQIEADLNKYPDTKDDERLAHRLGAEEKDRLTAADVLRAETVEDNERAARRMQAELDNEGLAAQTACDEIAAANERAARELQAEEDNNRAAAEKSRRDALANDERIAREVDAETRLAHNTAEDERIARQVQAELDGGIAAQDAAREEELALNERVALELQTQWNENDVSLEAQREEELAFNERVAREMQAEINESSDIKHINDIEEDERAARRIETEWNRDSDSPINVPGDAAWEERHAPGWTARPDSPAVFSGQESSVDEWNDEPYRPVRSYTSETNTEDLYGLTPPRSPVIPPNTQPPAFSPSSDRPTSDGPLDAPGGTGLQYDVVRLRGDGHPSGPVDWIFHHWGRPSITLRYRMRWHIRIDLGIVHKSRDDVTFDATVQVTLEIIDDMPDYEEAEADLWR